jgi:hypothetical protein
VGVGSRQIICLKQLKIIFTDSHRVCTILGTFPPVLNPDFLKNSVGGDMIGLLSPLRPQASNHAQVRS